MFFSLRFIPRRGALLIVATVCAIGFEPKPRAAPVVATHIAAVVELFTSQGCSSCPPADRFLATLARAPDVIALSLPIDYWDFMGWHDTLASPAFTARQKAYAEARGDGRIYTPQMVIDGLADAVGSDKTQVAKVIAANKGREGALSVPIRLAEMSGTLHINIGAGPAATAGVYVLSVIPSQTVAIGRGENSGRTITYTNVVRAIRKIGDWHGAAQSYTLSEPGADHDAYVVLLQKGLGPNPGVILAAAKGSGL